MDAKSKEWWERTSGQSQAKESFKEERPDSFRNLLSKDGKTVKMIVDLKTGHCRLYMHKQV